MKQYAIQPGSRYPTGATADSNGTNFSIFSRNATSVELLLYERADSHAPFQIIELKPETNRTYFFWHVYVEGLQAGVHYAWRVDGPNDTKISGCRFDRNIELLDPWARAVTQNLWDRRLSIKECGEDLFVKMSAPHPSPKSLYASSYASSDIAPKSMRATVVANHYGWDGDRPLDRPLENTIIYEMHVGGFTRHPSSNVKNPGTFSGVVEKIPYLKSLGITDVELMPVMAFDEQDVPDSAFERGHRNYWGYSTHSFFSPHPGYCASPQSGAHVDEFRDMVKALHKAGIGVILDVVLNHTAEGGADGPVINFKGFSNDSFYHLDPDDRSKYRDFTGCGNTVNCNHPLVAVFILQCLEYWVREMHVDGFRFDLASVLTRGEDGNPINHAPVVWSIEFSEILADAKIIAEAWDAGGLYQVGAFPGFRWAEWNGKYRDIIRRFVRGDRGLVGEVATRITGSSDLYEVRGRLPISSINYVTCHDGFTLYDLVSYNEKHNFDNGELNRDGSNENLSWNCGHEGDTDDVEIQALRLRQAKNFIAILMLSQGVPMLQSGDEVLRSQKGNNNAYCQDNELGWFDWTLIRKNDDMLRFVTQMIAFRKRHPCLRRARFLTGRKNLGAYMPDIVWHGVEPLTPGWFDPSALVLAFTLAAATDGEEDLHVILNMSDEQLDIPVYSVSNKIWHAAVDTSRSSPDDILELAQQAPLEEESCRVNPRSVVVLESRQTANRIL